MTLTVIDIQDYTHLPKGEAYVWIAASTLEDALSQTRRKLTGKVYRWKNVWAFEVAR